MCCAHVYIPLSIIHVLCPSYKKHTETKEQSLFPFTFAFSLRCDLAKCSCLVRNSLRLALNLRQSVSHSLQDRALPQNKQGLLMKVRSHGLKGSEKILSSLLVSDSFSQSKETKNFKLAMHKQVTQTYCPRTHL